MLELAIVYTFSNISREGVLWIRTYENMICSGMFFLLYVCEGLCLIVAILWNP